MFAKFSIFISSVFFILGTNLFASIRQAPIVINIDNPSFRKLISAVPQMISEGEQDAKMAEWRGYVDQELTRLFKITGYFKMLTAEAYKGLEITPASFQKLDVPSWKNIGVESLTLTKIAKEKNQNYHIELSTYDIIRGQNFSKGYNFANNSELDAILKKYTDLLLTSYTGRPGIFTSRIVFIGRKTKESYKQVFTCDIDGKNLKQITTDRTIHVGASWSPDSSKIIYTSYAKNNPDLYLIDLTTNKIEKLADGKGINSGGAFSNNGKLIAYTGSTAGNSEIYLYLSKSANRVPFLYGHSIDVDPSFSPDGKWLAFVSGRYGNPHIFKATLTWDGEAKINIAEEKQLTFAGWYNANPSWSPDSQKISFAGFDKEINRFDIFMMNHDGTALERLTINRGNNESPTWSPNGQKIIFHSDRIGETDVRGVDQLYIMNRDGSEQTRIDTGLYEAQSPKWSSYLLEN